MVEILGMWPNFFKMIIGEQENRREMKKGQALPYNPSRYFDTSSIPISICRQVGLLGPEIAPDR
jgi:hypothetical protein